MHRLRCDVHPCESLNAFFGFAWQRRYGDPARARSADQSGDLSDRSFFLPPYWEMVTLYWSRGRRRERRDLAITVGQEQKGHSYLGLGWRAVP